MKKPSIENIIKHNENIIEKCRTQDLYPHLKIVFEKYRAMGWNEALNYILNNYNLEEK
tara:strand:- start:283 stop:456 length:174 start_codon:yes stop_codon:yes gene_type:complete